MEVEEIRAMTADQRATIVRLLSINGLSLARISKLTGAKVAEVKQVWKQENHAQ